MADERSTLQRGRLVAATLAGAWRAAPPPSISADELDSIAPILVQSGSASLAWWQLRHSVAAALPVATRLRDAYYWHAVEARLHEQDIARTVATLQAAGVEPLLAKGWAVARLYPSPALRPYGDVDLCVRPEQRAAANAALAAHPAAFTPVDLHVKIVDMPDRSFDDLYARSSGARLGDVQVRVLGIEDHLRFLCLHLLRHGARRPLWLCDIGVVLDALPSSFDWRHFVSGEQRRTSWALGVLGLAHRLLGARLEHEAVAARARQLPDWLIPTVLHQWGDDFRPRSSRLMRMALGRADWFLLGLRERWPNPIEATYWQDGPIAARFRLRYQLEAYVGRSLSFAALRPHGAH